MLKYEPQLIFHQCIKKRLGSCQTLRIHRVVLRKQIFFVVRKKTEAVPIVAHDLNRIMYLTFPILFSCNQPRCFSNYKF